MYHLEILGRKITSLVVGLKYGDQIGIVDNLLTKWVMFHLQSGQMVWPDWLGWHSQIDQIDWVDRVGLTILDWLTKLDWPNWPLCLPIWSILTKLNLTNLDDQLGVIVGWPNGLTKLDFWPNWLTKWVPIWSLGHPFGQLWSPVLGDCRLDYCGGCFGIHAVIHKYCLQQGNARGHKWFQGHVKQIHGL